MGRHKNSEVGVRGEDSIGIGEGVGSFYTWAHLEPTMVNARVDFRVGMEGVRRGSGQVWDCLGWGLVV